MRGVTWFVIGVLWGCGSDSPVDNTGEEPLDAGEQPPPACVPADVEPASGFEGERPWHHADLDACKASCATLAEDCIAMHCPGYADFDACVKDELDACLTARGGPCRAPWESLLCCASDHCAEVDDAMFSSCLQSSCNQPSSDFKGCQANAVQGASAMTDACLESARQRCLAPEPDAGEPLADGGVSDAGEVDAGTSDAGDAG